MFLGGLIGLIIMRFAANAFVKLLHTRPTLETAAFLIVGWVGVKLAFLLLHTRCSDSGSAFSRINRVENSVLDCINWNCTWRLFPVG